MIRSREARSYALFLSQQDFEFVRCLVGRGFSRDTKKTGAKRQPRCPRRFRRPQGRSDRLPIHESDALP
jgi:hypothetical protein